MGLRMGCAKGRAWGGGGGGLTTGFWRLPRRGPHQEDVGAWAASAMRGLTSGCWPRAVRGDGGGWQHPVPLPLGAGSAFSDNRSGEAVLTGGAC